MYRRIAKFLKLERNFQRLLLEAFYDFLVMRRRLRIHTFRKLVQGLDRTMESGQMQQPDQRQEQAAARVGWAVRTVGSQGTELASCLLQVLVAQRMLSRRGIPGVIVVGATSTHGVNLKESFAAHAWLKCGDTFITGEAGYELYTPITRFSWKVDSGRFARTRGTITQLTE